MVGGVRNALWVYENPGSGIWLGLQQNQKRIVTATSHSNDCMTLRSEHLQDIARLINYRGVESGVRVGSVVVGEVINVVVALMRNRDAGTVGSIRAVSRRNIAIGGKIRGVVGHHGIVIRPVIGSGRI